MFGVHKFINKKFGMGILYFFTAGLFGIGWTVDCIIAFIAIFASSNNAHEEVNMKPSTSPLPTASTSTNFTLTRNLEILHDCIRLVSETTNPDTYFSRRELYFEHLPILTQVPESGINLERFPYICLILEKPNNLDQKQLDDNFIDRYWNATIEKAQKLKTDKGKNNQYENFRKNMEKYDSMLLPDSVIRYKEKQPNELIIPEPESSALKVDEITYSPNIRTNDTPNWIISIAFSKSTSSAYSQAVALAMNAPKYQTYEIEGKTIHEAFFSEEPSQYLAFVKLYEMVSNWKSAFTKINGELVDRKIVGGLNYCYGDFCRNGRTDFCFGASEYTKNPFGCHRLQVSDYNHPWYSYASKKGNYYEIDKEEIKRRIDEFSTAYKVCPHFDYEHVLDILYHLPTKISEQDMTRLNPRGIFTDIKDYIDIDSSTLPTSKI